MLEDGASRHSVLGTIFERIYRDVVSSVKGRQDQQNCIRRGGRMRETHVLAVERRYGVYLRLCGHRRSTAGPGPMRSLPKTFPKRACQWSSGNSTLLDRVRLHSSTGACLCMCAGGLIVPYQRLDPAHHHVPDCPHRFLFLFLFQFPVRFQRRFGSIREDDKEQAPRPSSRHPTTILRLPHRHSHRASRHCLNDLIKVAVTMRD
jgi:hypothetical protein